MAFLGLAAFLGLSLGISASAQEKDKKEAPAPVKPAMDAGKDAKDAKADGPQYRLKNAVMMGYTRPGSPDDTIKNGKVVPAAFTDTKDKILGGTVYFMVLERVGGGAVADRDAGDTWGTGMGDFDGRFTPGRNFDGGVSPRLDTKAKYLYLYQIVNDRGLEPQAIAPAGFNAVRAEDLAGFGLKLLVDPRYITSWGHFQGSAFNAVAKDRNQINAIRTAADGTETPIRLAVSANPSIVAELPNHRYMYRSPAYNLGKLARTMEVGSDVENLKKSFNDEYLTKNKGAIQAAFVENELKADLEGAKEPAFVQLMYFGGEDQLANAGLFNGGILNAGLFNGGLANVGVVNAGLVNNAVINDETPARGMFRVDWRGANFMKLGQHSVAFGFTSDLPPVHEPIGIADAESALRGNGIRQVIADGSITPAAAPGTAPGMAPTPSGAPGGGGGGGAMMSGGGLASLGGGGGIGGGGLGFPGGGIGLARAPLIGGGTGGGTTGATTGTTTGTTPTTPTTTTPTTATTQAQTGSQQGGQTINFTATLTNQQQQQQQQQQAQLQNQRNNNNNHHNHGHNVVPAPASLLLALLGLPGLFMLRRRQKQALQTASA
jgi:hypothetical protein